MKGLIVSAGQGTRLRSIAASKPLAPVLGVPLIERVILSARAGGIDEFVVVTGYEGARVERFLKTLSHRTGIPITCVRNLAWRKANGVSVLAAGPHLSGQFVLMMSDHLFDPELLSDLLARVGPEDGVTLAVDRRLDNPLVDLEDVTRVATDGAGRITAIGKLMEPYDAFDTGVFLAGPALLEALRADVEAGGAGSISAGMTALAHQGRAYTHDVGERFWLDVDDPTAFEQAERLSA